MVSFLFPPLYLYHSVCNAHSTRLLIFVTPDTGMCAETLKTALIVRFNFQSLIFSPSVKTGRNWALDIFSETVTRVLKHLHAGLSHLPSFGQRSEGEICSTHSSISSSSSRHHTECIPGCFAPHLRYGVGRPIAGSP